MGVKVLNLDAFDASVQSWFAAVKGAAEQAAVGLARRIFDKVLLESPQYSGDFAANWKVGLAPTTDFTPNAVGFGGIIGAYGRTKPQPLERGDPKAITYAKAHAVFPKITLGQSIFISNAAAHDEPYAFKIEEGLIKFRPVNEGSAHVGRRSVRFVAERFPYISAAALAVLRRT